MSTLEQLKFPIGTFIKREEYSAEEISKMIEDIASVPLIYKKLAQSLTTGDLSKNYRAGSWNVQQLFHHVADIQLLHYLIHYLRMKRAVTVTKQFRHLR